MQAQLAQRLTSIRPPPPTALLSDTSPRPASEIEIEDAAGWEASACSALAASDSGVLPSELAFGCSPAAPAAGQEATQYWQLQTQRCRQ